MKSVGKMLEEHRGYGPGFDFLRVFLALSIVGLHSFTVTNQFFPWGEARPIWFIHYALVPMFFALSGFLVTASANRLTLGTFLIHRILRIVPALAVDTVVCAAIIGPLATTVSLSSYFSSQEFYHYFFNIIGFVHYDLPGVFRDFPVSRVNGSLWTVPFEIICYMIISIMIMTKAIRTKYVILIIIVGYISLSCLMGYLDPNSLFQNSRLAKLVSVTFVEYEAQAVTAFLCGIVLFQNREVIPYSRALFVFCVLLSVLISCTISSETGYKPWMRFLLMPLITYTTVFLGLTSLKVPKLFKSGDYSYGIYLYHQPFLQVVILIFPSIALAAHYGASFTFVAAIPFILGIAYLSWHCIEKPTLKLRKVIDKHMRKTAFNAESGEARHYKLAKTSS